MRGVAHRASRQRGFSVWKVSIAFVLFSVLAIYVLMKGGSSLDMSGEKHGIEVHAPAAASAPTPATPASAVEVPPVAAASAAAPAAASAASR